MANRGESRITPDVARNFDISPAASVVDKQGRYSPQLGDAGQLKATADGLAKLAKGMSDVDALMQRQANEQVFVAMAKTEEKNRKDCNEVFNKIEGMAKFNPYNKEAYKTLRAKANMEEGIYKLAELEATGGDLKYEEFEAHRQKIISDTLANMDSEGLKARHKADYIVKLQNQSFLLKDKFVTKKAEQDYQILQNQMISSTSKDIATLTYLNPDGFVSGWNEAVKRLEDITDSVGMDSTKKKELLDKTIAQYLMDNVDDVDAEDFMLALGQTKIGGQALSDYDPNYATTMKQMLVKAKQAKYEIQKMDLDAEKLRLEKETLEAQAEMFNFAGKGGKSEAELTNKAMEIIKNRGMESVGYSFLNKVANDDATLIRLQTAKTRPAVYKHLMQKYIQGTLTREDIELAHNNETLSSADAGVLFNTLKNEATQDYTGSYTALKELYLDAKPVVELSFEHKQQLSEATYDIISNPELTKAEKAEGFLRLKKIGEHFEAEENRIKQKDPTLLLEKEYLKKQKLHNQSLQNAQRAAVKMRMFKNQAGFNDTNLTVTSAMTEDKQAVSIKTTAGRTVVAPMTGEVVASGFDTENGHYILLKTANNSGFVKLLHLQEDGLPATGTHVIKGYPLARVGNTGTMDIECFDKRLKAVDNEQFLKGR
jgi:murein DD-endopeptidase MepM/ murein hydrolase activator NlpD